VGVSPSSVSDDERRTLDDLHRRVKARLAGLEAALAGVSGQRDAMKALVIYLDERIMERLPEYLRPSWPLLQRDHTGSTTGGEDFYRFVSELSPGAPSFVFEVYYFCLANGFVGRYANDMESIERYRHQLRESIDAPRTLTDGPDTAEVSMVVVKPVAAWLPYGVALVGVVAVTTMLTILSNY
jgi:type VI protein secretion system component VasF